MKFFKLSGYVSHIITDDKVFYLGCPDCRRKVIEEIAGFKCESCNKVQSTCIPTYMMSAKVTDVSGSMFI